MAAAELTQIYYSDYQKEACYTFARLYFNEKLTIHFENSIIERVVMASNADKVSVCSWRLREKFKYFIGPHREFTQEVLESDYDVLSLTKNSRFHNMLAAADKWHPGFKPAFERIMSGIGFNCPKEVKIPIYQNHFSAKREIYQDYVKRYLRPAMNFIENDPEVNKMAMMDSNYSKLDKRVTDNHESLMKQIGVPYYPLVPFLLERLFSVYIHNENINVSWL